MPVNCTVSDACTVGYCSSDDGLCYTTPYDCNDYNPCTTDTCSVVNGSPVCSHSLISCNGNIFKYYRN